MSESPPGEGWWIASDGRWYPPELHPDRAGPPQVAFEVGPSAPPADSLASWAPAMATPLAAPPLPSSPPQGTHPDPNGQVIQPQEPTRSGGRFGRGLKLVGIGFAMARDEPGLMMVPVVAFVLQLVIIGAGVVLILPGLRASSGFNGGRTHLTAGQWAVAVAVGVLVTFVSVVSHATIIARVMARFHGERVTNAQAARAALTKSPQLLAWTFINYVVISVLRNISNRGILGLLVGWLLRAGWILASFFVVPVILFENRGAVAAIKRSVALCRARWGENVVGNSALGIIGMVAVLVDAAVAVLLGTVFAPLGVAVGVLGLISILLVLTVASAAFNAGLYWFAVTGQSPGQYSVGDLQAAYRPRRRKTGVYGY